MSKLFGAAAIRMNEAPAFSAILFDGQPRKARPASLSRFERMALLAQGQTDHVGRLLEVLLAATRPDDRGAPWPASVWAEEAMHRAYTLIRLAAMMRPANDHSAAAEMDAVLSQDLACRFRSLETGGDHHLLPCSDILRTMAIELCELFGAVRDISVRTKIEPVLLRKDRRRALILAAAELMMNALLHGFDGATGGQIQVSLMREASRVRLRVADNGAGWGRARPDRRGAIAGRLARTLGTETVYERDEGWTVAQIIFSDLAASRRQT